MIYSSLGNAMKDSPPHLLLLLNHKWQAFDHYCNHLSGSTMSFLPFHELKGLINHKTVQNTKCI